MIENLVYQMSRKALYIYLLQFRQLLYILEGYKLTYLYIHLYLFQSSIGCYERLNILLLNYRRCRDCLQGSRSPNTKFGGHVTITGSAARIWACGGRCVGGGCGTGTVSRVSGKAMDRFQCTWVTIIGEMHELIAEYLGNGSSRNLLTI